MRHRQCTGCALWPQLMLTQKHRTMHNMHVHFAKLVLHSATSAVYVIVDKTFKTSECHRAFALVICKVIVIINDSIDDFNKLKVNPDVIYRLLTLRYQNGECKTTSTRFEVQDFKPKFKKSFELFTSAYGF